MDQWLGFLKSHYGASWDESGRTDGKYRAMLLTYGPSQLVPRRIPTPHGPLKDAALSTVQMVSGYNANGISSGLIYQSGATEVVGAIEFKLDDLSQVATFSSLFDQYRIDRVHLRIRPKNTAFFLASVASPNQASPDILLVADFDDSTAPASSSELKQYQNVVIMNGGDSLDAIIEPSLTPAIYSGGAFSGYGVENSRWLDIANTSIPHYGVKFAVTALQATATYSYQWDVEAWYQVSFRNVR